jgi:hypothetical protein
MILTIKEFVPVKKSSGVRVVSMESGGFFVRLFKVGCGSKRRAVGGEIRYQCRGAV